MTAPATQPLDPSKVRVFLFEALNEVLEMLAYTVACDELPEEVLEVERCLTAQIAFSGDREGRLAITVSHPLAFRIAASLTGLDQGALEERADLLEDAVRETANVAAGVFLRRVAVEGLEYRLGVPTIVACPSRPRARESLGISLAADAIEGPIGVYLEIGSGTFPTSVEAEAPA